MAKRVTKTNNSLFKEANRYLVGGVDSPVRSFGYVGGKPLLARSGCGAKIYDYDGKAYIDYVLSWGALILGHAHPSVMRDLKHSLSDGLSFGATNSKEVELAGLIHDAIPFVEKIRFTNSGTEAVMGALRLARGATKRDKIVKFTDSYHGHADYLLAKAGSGLATLGLPSSAGVPKDFTKHTIIAPYGDSDSLENIFEKYGSQIATVIVEPIGGNHGVVAPDPAFLEKLRRVTKNHGALLIFDEVITGFRFNYGSIAREFAIMPDIICLGKIIGGGLPIGAFGGSADVMNNLAPLGNVYQASTFAGNPVTMQAGISTLKALRAVKNDYELLDDLTRYLVANIKSEANTAGIKMEAARYESIFSFKFIKRSDFRRFYRKMFEGGVFFAPSEFEANFLSFAHTRKDIEETIVRAEEVFNKLR